MARTPEAELERLRAVREIIREVMPDLSDEGRIHHARKIILRIGQGRLGQPSPETVEVVKTLQNLGRIERMSNRVLYVQSWAELLETT